MTAEAFDALRPSAFAIAYRTLGSARRGEDLGREGFLRPHGSARISEQNAGQLATRARRHVEEHYPRFEASREQREELGDDRDDVRPGRQPYLPRLAGAVAGVVHGA